MMLKLFLTACLLVSAFSENVEVFAPVCGSCIDNLCYSAATNFGDYYHLMVITGTPAFDVTENILYYRHHIFLNDMKLDKDVQNTYPQNLPNMLYATGNTIDQKTRQVYIWTPPNDEAHYFPFTANMSLVSRYDPVTNTTEQLEVTNEAVKEMHFKEKLYYTLEFRNGIFEYHHGTSNSIQAFEGYNVTQFIVDKLEDIYATTETGVYRLKKGAVQVTLFTDQKYSLSVDKDDKMYFLDSVLKKVLKLDYISDKIVDAGLITGEVRDRIIFDKYNNILLKITGYEGSENAAWSYLVSSGQCRMNGTTFHFVWDSSCSL